MKPKKLLKKQLATIAFFHGYQMQSRQIVEEMAELTVAINKMYRKCKGMIAHKNDKVYQDVVEELADVEIMTEQMKILLDCHEEVKTVKKEKIRREIERIKGEVERHG